MELLIMCFEFAKIGLFAVGGGIAAIPFLLRIAENYPHWFTVDELTYMIAVGESTPGPIGVNIATYAGFNVAGIIGALLATFSLILPSFIIMIFIAKALNKFRENKYIAAAFEGLRPAVTGLIGVAAYTVVSLTIFTNQINIKYIALYILLFVLMQAKKTKKLHPLLFIAFSALCGIIFSF